jgi:hypothetical protein
MGGDGHEKGSCRASSACLLIRVCCTYNQLTVCGGWERGRGKREGREGEREGERVGEVYGVEMDTKARGGVTQSAKLMFTGKGLFLTELRTGKEGWRGEVVWRRGTRRVEERERRGKSDRRERRECRSKRRRGMKEEGVINY